MAADPSQTEPAALAVGEQARWQADVTTLRDEQCQHHLYPLRMGDLFNEMQSRWGDRMADLARSAGVPYHTARQHAPPSIERVRSPVGSEPRP
jgi:hypothetical protein